MRRLSGKFCSCVCTASTSRISASKSAVSRDKIWDRELSLSSYWSNSLRWASISASRVRQASAKSEWTKCAWTEAEGIQSFDGRWCHFSKWNYFLYTCMCTSFAILTKSTCFGVTAHLVALDQSLEVTALCNPLFFFVQEGSSGCEPRHQLLLRNVEGEIAPSLWCVLLHILVGQRAKVIGHRKEAGRGAKKPYASK